MPNHLGPSLPLQKSSEITKYLRSRDVPLRLLLPFASTLLGSSQPRERSTCFPQQEDWLLEWLVQRLREDGADTMSARCDPGFWKFLLRLLPSSSSASTILKRHNLLQLISTTFSEAAALPAVTATVGQDGGIRVEKEDIYSTSSEMVSSPSSSSTERGLAWTELQELLRSVGAVVLYLQRNMAEGTREGNVVAVLRGPPEVAAQILGSYLMSCHSLVQNELGLDEDCIGAVVNVWRGCVWGNPNSKKLSTIFSASCLIPVAQLLATSLTPSYLRYKVEQLVSEFIFSHRILFPSSGTKSAKPSARHLKPLLGPLKAKRESLPHLFKVGIASQARRRRGPDPDIVEVIFESITNGALGIELPVGTMDNSDAELVMKLLDVLVDTGTTVSSETLASLVDGISNLCHKEDEVRWHMVEVALKLDFDIFLGKGNETRASKLIATVTSSKRGRKIVFRIIELLINGFVKARDLEGFVKSWMLELDKEGVPRVVWESDRVAELFADRMEESLLPGQIDRTLRTACQEGSWVIVDAVLRGVRREDTEDKIRGILSEVAEKVLMGEAGWRGWRSLVRALQIEGGLVKNMHGKVLNEMKRSEAGGNEDDTRRTLFAGGVLMDIADISGQEEVLIVATKAMRGVRKGWGGSVDHVDQENLGIAMVAGIMGKWLGAVELASSNVRAGFVDVFLDMATKDIIEEEERNIIGRTVWRGMLINGLIYEYPALKDAVLAALIAKLEPFSRMSWDVKNSLTKIRNGRSISISQHDVDIYEFLLESITRYPLEAIKRTTRERILDTLVLLDAALDIARVYGPVRDGVKGLVERLWTLGNAGSFLAKDASGFMDWALGRGKKTGRRILRYAFATKQQEQSREFLTDVRVLAEREFICMGQPVINVVKVCEVIVEEFWRAGEENTVKQLREEMLKTLYESIQTGKASGDLVGVWRRMWVLGPNLNNGKEALALAQSIIGNVKTALPRILRVTEKAGNDASMEEATKVIAETAMLLCACSRTVEEVVNTTALVVAIVDSLLAVSYKSDILLAYSDMVSNTLDPAVYLGCLGEVVEVCFSLGNENPVQPGYWEALRILINGAKKPKEVESSKNMAVCLSAVFSKMAQNLPRSKTVAEFLALTDCMNIILREKTWAVMQYNIDETLTSITITSSPSGPMFSLAAVAADEIFLRLCHLPRLVLSLHRRRIRGSRYHLVITALQSLLRCIYKRKPPGERKKSDKVVHPPWLLGITTYGCGETAVKIPAITGKCAESFNRVVTTLCEPSASSVRNRMRKETDHSLVHNFRDHEKREVASCVSSLLGGILKGNLEGGFEGDITISLSAIFELLGAEGVKALARTVDKEGRAMLREFWDEYNRVGGGASEKL